MVTKLITKVQATQFAILAGPGEDVLKSSHLGFLFMVAFPVEGWRSYYMDGTRIMRIKSGAAVRYALAAPSQVEIDEALQRLEYRMAIRQETPEEPTNIGTIKIGRGTEQHDVRLRHLGYEVKACGDHLDVVTSGWVLEVDISQGMEPLRRMVAERKAMMYTTRVKFPDGKTLFGIPACLRLGALSCLMMKPKTATKSPSGLSLDDWGSMPHPRTMLKIDHLLKEEK